MNQRLLVVDDDSETVNLLRLYLERDGYHVLTAGDDHAALAMARQKRPDLILLDLMRPAIDGLEVCRTLRRASRIPIIMLTARTTEEDKLLGLDLGADDYITKPFSPREVVARVRAVLRRVGERALDIPTVVRHGALLVDLVSREASLSGAPLHLTPREFQILEALMREPGRTFTRLDLVERVFGSDYAGLERTVDVHIMKLRKKIEADPARPIYIQTVFGVGYKFAEAEHAA